MEMTSRLSDSRWTAESGGRSEGDALGPPWLPGRSCVATAAATRSRPGGAVDQGGCRPRL